MGFGADPDLGKMMRILADPDPDPQHWFTGACAFPKPVWSKGA